MISVNEYKPSRRDAKIAKLIAQGEEPKRAAKKVAKRYECIIRTTLPSGQSIIDRKLTPATTESGAADWARARERSLLAEAYNPTPVAKKRVPTLAEWWPDYMETCMSTGGAEGEGLTDATCDNKQSCFDAWLNPHLGNVQLDLIDDKKRDALQLALKKAGRSQTNILQALSSCLNKAVERKLIATLPCKFAELAKLKNKSAQNEAPFYTYDQYAALLAAAPDLVTEVIILLGGDAGLRAGEICGLEWSAISFERMEITVRKAIWYGVPTIAKQAWIKAGRPKGKGERPKRVPIEKSPKHGKIRRVPLSPRLASALRKLRLQTRGDRVFTQPDGQWVHYIIVKRMLRVAEQRAKLERLREGCVHVLRHTFLSHLALTGKVSPQALMTLAGHHSLTVTQRYLWLMPNSEANAVAALAASRAAETRPATKRDEVVTS